MSRIIVVALGFSAVLYCSNALALVACAIPNGIRVVGPAPGTIIDGGTPPFDVTPIEEIRRDIGEKTQDFVQFRAISNSSNGVTLQYTLKVGPVTQFFNLSDPPSKFYAGQTSIGKHVLNRFDVDLDEDDPWPCLATGGDSGGGGGCGGNPAYDQSFDKYDGSGCWSPVLIDLDKNGIHLGNMGIGVSFDARGDGSPVYIQWVEPMGREAFLAIDLNHNGVVDDGSELFGQATRMILDGGELATNGFVALAQYDEPQLGGNADDTITAQDQVWRDLVLWLDHNADGVSTVEEILQLSDIALIALDVTPKENNRRDGAGNWLPLWSWAEADAKPTKMKMVDVFFRRLEP